MNQYLYFTKKQWKNNERLNKNPLLYFDKETLQYYYIHNTETWNDNYQYLNQFHKVYLHKNPDDDTKDYIYNIKRKGAMFDKRNNKWFITKASSTLDNFLYLVSLYNSNYITEEKNEEVISGSK